MDLSLVIPLFNEDESLPELTAWIQRVMEANNYSYEVLFIDDGSTDNSWNVIEDLTKNNSNIKGIKFQRNYGKSAALNEGFKAAKGEVIITMDADMQDSPDEIPELRNMILSGDFDIVSGWKKKRYDNTLTKNLPSKLFNAAARKSSGIKLHDFNCGLKAYKKKVVKSIEVYGEMHRYIPVLAKWAGFKKIGEKVVEHRPRKYGVTKFGWERFINGFLDLFSIMFVGKFGKRPMHFFGLWGTFFFMFGLIVFVYLTLSKFLFDHTGLTQRPL
ncbi:MAG: glycosyltransferase family 2 protein, partial [Ferruginibacter sp.]